MAAGASGQEPNFPTTVALIETARRSARQKVLESELYPQLSATAAAQTERELAEISAAAAAEARRLREVRDPNRWRRSMVEVSELAERIVSRVWGTAGTFEFRMLALSLVQQRIEDNEPTPTTSADPVREELEAMIDDQIRSQTTPF
ncbi:hypothetical protein GS491_26595 [Rhodococcus hoagii]|nr:hypothetical protein [Prescottella equi]